MVDCAADILPYVNDLNVIYCSRNLTTLILKCWMVVGERLAPERKIYFFVAFCETDENIGIFPIQN